MIKLLKFNFLMYNNGNKIRVVKKLMVCFQMTNSKVTKRQISLHLN